MQLYKLLSAVVLLLFLVKKIKNIMYKIFCSQLAINYNFYIFPDIYFFFYSFLLINISTKNLYFIWGLRDWYMFGFAKIL